VVLLAACGNAVSSVSTAGNTDGVFSNHIVVGGLASLSGPLPADFAPSFAGVDAYFDMVNAAGGVDGRTLDFAYPLDDGSDPGLDTGQARTLVEQDHVFAVVGVATPTFSGATFLADNDVPTFGMDINPNSQWGAGPSMFGDSGSYQDFTAPDIPTTYLAQQHHATSAAVLSYGVAASQQGCQGVINGFHEYGIPITFEDLSIPAPATDLHADVSQLEAHHVDFIVSCMDVGGNVLLSNTMQQDGETGVSQLWFDGYDEGDLAQYSPSMQGVTFEVSHVPFGVSTTEPGAYPGMDQFIAALAKYAPGTPPSEAALSGWESADLFVTGLRAAGRNVSRTALVSAINKMTDYTANGILPPVDWETSHGPGTGSSAAPTPTCIAYVQVQGNRFVTIDGTSTSVFTCFPGKNPAKPPIVPLATTPAGLSAQTKAR
jgi:ABC-type branched-subunit amino acid transport system substrate-binding protein